MTELYIDGVAVVLPKEMSLQVKRENPFFTKNGEYTYDLTLDLSNKVNGELYSHLNRLNSVGEIVEKRRALLIADNRVYCDGIEIITGWTDSTVTIQIASGNSELNYFIGGDVLISSLKMGVASVPRTSSDRLTYINKRYPEVPYCLTPVCIGGSEIVNNWKYFSSGTDYRISEESRVIIQPYLCEYLERVIKALGYSIEENQLAQGEFKYLYICNPIDTLEYSKMLPGWKVSDFMQEMERMFYLVFSLDQRKRNVRITHRSCFYQNTPVQHVASVIDTYEAEYDTTSVSDDSKTLSYALGDSRYNRRHKLAKEIMESSTYIVKSTYSEVLTFFRSSASTGREIVLNQATDTEYIRTSKDGVAMPVNEWKDLNRGTDDILELNIVPADIQFNHWQEYIPFINAIEGADETAENPQKIEDILNAESNLSKNDPSKNVICIAFYKGNVPYPGTLKRPMSFTDFLIDYSWYSYYSVEKYIADNGETLRLAYLEKVLNGASYNIEDNKAIKITSYDSNLYNPHGVFEIRNRRYVCKEMEYVLTESGRKNAWVGTFYPIKISDTEAEQRWILTDGRWRDGGIYIDNGRWVDE